MPLKALGIWFKTPFLTDPSGQLHFAMPQARQLPRRAHETSRSSSDEALLPDPLSSEVCGFLVGLSSLP